MLIKMIKTKLVTGMPGFTSEEARWGAVVRRDGTADGMFHYSVRTTGVYCRPSCASRLARRENVTLHLTCAEAERAGFRPCKRCRPNEAGLAEQHAAAVARAGRLMEDGDEAPGLNALAEVAGMSRFHFHRVFRAVTGVTPKAYADAVRRKRVREGLVSSRTVTEAIYGAGFNSSGRFYEKSGEMLGMTPTEFRAGGGDAEIRYAAGQCSLGTVLVASTERGVCAILLGDDAKALVRDLEARFPRARLISGDRDFERTVGEVVRFVEAPGTALELPLDVRGTAFQERVWQALRAIPSGARASYGEIAERIGSPKAARAVAQACAANALAVAIPCHRVVRQGGGLGGYRWGLPRKLALLEREAKP